MLNNEQHRIAKLAEKYATLITAHEHMRRANRQFWEGYYS